MNELWKQISKKKKFAVRQSQHLTLVRGIKPTVSHFGTSLPRNETDMKNYKQSFIERYRQARRFKIKPSLFLKEQKNYDFISAEVTPGLPRHLLKKVRKRNQCDNS